ncbi:MAG: DUF5103 domain-containing protein [Cytophagales bacterium]|nr:DUF5103 domain-containing protein [Cytophagales bacterium]
MDLHKIAFFNLNRILTGSVTPLAAFSLLYFSVSITVVAQKTLQFSDVIYDPRIKTVLSYAQNPSNGLPASIAPLRNQQLVLEFDDLQEEKANYYVRFIHCNYDWTKSGLRDLEILSDYNEFPIQDYSFSINTDIPYVHYRIPLPPVKLPGNYLVVVYKDGNKGDLILTRRILVFDNQMTLSQNDNLSGLGNLKSTNQALNFQLNYGRMELLNPAGTVHVIIRQNQRWDNAKKDVQPSFIRENTRQLEYRFFDMDNTFSAGNEFRFVDFRSLNFPGQNTDRLDRSKRPVTIFVAEDAPRGYQAYAQYPDMNGNFSIENQDTRQEPWISTNYVYVNFSLRSAPIDTDVYVLGAFNQWALGPENKLRYEDGHYTQRILLKQGFYNYQYWVRPSASTNGNQLEGNHFQTENLYDVLVYYRPFQPNADLLVGYFMLPVNPR